MEGLNERLSKQIGGLIIELHAKDIRIEELEATVALLRKQIPEVQNSVQGNPQSDRPEA